MRRYISLHYPPLALLLLASCTSFPTDTGNVCKTAGTVPVSRDFSTWETVSISEANEVLSSIGGEGPNEIMQAMRHGGLTVDSETPIRLQRRTNITEISVPFVSECIRTEYSVQRRDVLLCFTNPSGTVLSENVPPDVSDDMVVERVRQTAKNLQPAAILPQAATVKRFGPLAKVVFLLGESADDDPDAWESTVESWVDIPSDTVLSLTVGGLETR